MLRAKKSMKNAFLLSIAMVILGGKKKLTSEISFPFLCTPLLLFKSKFLNFCWKFIIITQVKVWKKWMKDENIQNYLIFIRLYTASSLSTPLLIQFDLAKRKNKVWFLEFQTMLSTKRIYTAGTVRVTCSDLLIL